MQNLGIRTINWEQWPVSQCPNKDGQAALGRKVEAKLTCAKNDLGTKFWKKEVLAENCATLHSISVHCVRQFR